MPVVNLHLHVAILRVTVHPANSVGHDTGIRSLHSGMAMINGSFVPESKEQNGFQTLLTYSRAG